MVDILRFVEADLTTVRLDLNSAAAAATGLRLLQRPDFGEIGTEAEWLVESPFPGGTQVAARHPIVEMNMRIAAVDTTYERLLALARALAGEVNRPNILEWRPTNATESIFFDTHPSPIPGLIRGDESTRYIVNRFRDPLGMPVTLWRHPYVRGAPLLASVNRLSNPTMLADSNLDGRPDNWTWSPSGSATIAQESINSELECYEFTTAIAVGSFDNPDIVPSSALPTLQGQAWLFSIDAQIASASIESGYNVRVGLVWSTGHVDWSGYLGVAGADFTRMSVAGTAPIGATTVLPVVEVRQEGTTRVRLRRAQLELFDYLPTEGSVVAWYDAGSLLLADDEAVTTWNDLSGHQRNVTQATAGLKPVCKTAILNGRRVVRFDGVDDYLHTSAAFLALNGGPWTAFVVAKNDNAGTAPDYLLGVDEGGLDRSFFLNWENANTFRMQHYGDYVDYPRAIDGSWHIIVAQYKDPGSEVWIDGVSIGASATTPSGDLATTTGQLLVGTSIGGGTNGWDGDIAEIVLVAGELSAAERERFQSVLAKKHNLAASLQAAYDTPTTFRCGAEDVSNDLNSAFGGQLLVYNPGNMPALAKITLEQGAGADALTASPLTEDAGGNGRPDDWTWISATDITNEAIDGPNEAYKFDWTTPDGTDNRELRSPTVTAAVNELWTAQAELAAVYPGGREGGDGSAVLYGSVVLEFLDGSSAVLLRTESAGTPLSSFKSLNAQALAPASTATVRMSLRVRNPAATSALDTPTISFRRSLLFKTTNVVGAYIGRRSDSDRLTRVVNRGRGRPLSWTVINDTFTRTVVDGWGSADTGGAYTNTTSAYDVNGSEGTISVAAGVGAVTTLPASGNASYVKMRYKYDKLPVGGNIKTRVAIRVTSSSNYYYVEREVTPGGTGTLRIGRVVGGVDTSLATIASNLVANTFGTLRAECVQEGSFTRLWASPNDSGGWSITATDNTAALQGESVLGGIVLDVAAAVSNGPILFTFDSWSLYSLLDFVKLLDTTNTSIETDNGIGAHNGLVVLVNETSAATFKPRARFGIARADLEGLVGTWRVLAAVSTANASIQMRWGYDAIPGDLLPFAGPKITTFDTESASQLALVDLGSITLDEDSLPDMLVLDLWVGPNAGASTVTLRFDAFVLFPADEPFTIVGLPEFFGAPQGQTWLGNELVLVAGTITNEGTTKILDVNGDQTGTPGSLALPAGGHYATAQVTLEDTTQVGGGAGTLVVRNVTDSTDTASVDLVRVAAQTLTEQSPVLFFTAVVGKTYQVQVRMTAGTRIIVRNVGLARSRSSEDFVIDSNARRAYTAISQQPLALAGGLIELAPGLNVVMIDYVDRREGSFDRAAGSGTGSGILRIVRPLIGRRVTARELRVGVDVTPRYAPL